MTDTKPPQSDVPSDPPPAQRHHPDASIKETLESIIVAFILAFVFRAFVVEAFVIPTGSMAPTLLGKHVSMKCPQCGYAFKCGPRREDMGVDKRTREPVPLTYQGLRRNDQGEWYGNPLEMVCPMCQHDIKEDVQRLQPGDRILVLKYIYAFQPPRRWDVVVFRNPEQPTQNYIKRLIGLENEWLRILRGNIYTSTDEGRTWQVQAKPPRVQRVVFQPIYRSKYIPLDAAERGWTSPWTPAGDGWTVNEFGRSFDYAGQGPAQLDFNFNQFPGSSKDYYPYNDLSDAGRSTTTHIEDLRVAMTIRAEQADAAVTVDMGTELFDIRASIGQGGQPALQMKPAGEPQWLDVGRTIKTKPIEPGKPTRLELWHVDHRVSLWIDGDKVAEYVIPLIEPEQADKTELPTLSMRQLLNEMRPHDPPTVSITLDGSPARLSEVNLDRDLYYTEQSVGSLGTHGNIAKLGPDEFFCLGDNSPASKDGRLWEYVDPWIPHTIGEVPVGIVPRKLMIGRAFFVYFPSPLKLSPTSRPIVPNFGDLRFID